MGVLKSMCVLVESPDLDGTLLSAQAGIELNCCKGPSSHVGFADCCTCCVLPELELTKHLAFMHSI